MDVVDKETRSRMMAGIRNSNTKPEILIRHALHGQGFRYRINNRNLPGKPDIVLKKYNAIIFVHGCFWHGHNCHLFRMPSTRSEFWARKIGFNRKRDKDVLQKLKDMGWRICIIWECSIKGKDCLDNFPALINNISDWIKSDNHSIEFGNNYKNE
jgi:DNA mismatch endonuclease (patch repair protein)